MTELEQLCRKKSREIIADIEPVWKNTKGDDERREWKVEAENILCEHLLKGARSWNYRLNLAAAHNPVKALDGVPEDNK